MYASYQSIKKAHMRGDGFPKNPSAEVKKAQELGYDINPAYVITPERKTKLTKSQKKDNNARASQEAELLSRYGKDKIRLDLGNEISLVRRGDVRIVQTLPGQHPASDRCD